MSVSIDCLQLPRQGSSPQPSFGLFSPQVITIVSILRPPVYASVVSVRSPTSCGPSHPRRSSCMFHSSNSGGKCHHQSQIPGAHVFVTRIVHWCTGSPVHHRELYFLFTIVHHQHSLLSVSRGSSSNHMPSPPKLSLSVSH